MEEVIFIDPNGNIIQYDNICSHVGVAAKLISENEELKQRYQESGCRVPNMFLMVYEGYIAVSVDPIYGMNLTVNSERLTDIQKEIVRNYLISGARLSTINEETVNALMKGRHEKQKKLDPK